MAEVQAVDVGDRRRVERRHASRVSELTLPEFRRIVLTSTLFVVVLLLFLWMVRTVIIAAILAGIVAFYLRPLYRRILRTVHRPPTAALLTLALLLVPLAAAAIYSWIELAYATGYLTAHEGEVVGKIDAALKRLPFFQGESLTDQIRTLVLVASNYGTRIVARLRATFTELAVATTIFFFTASYVLTDAATIIGYVRAKIAPRYLELVDALEANVRGVLYGAVYATLVTQSIKSIVVLAMNLVFGVPLAVVLALAAFVIGFFPIVGSWSVYVPVALWLGIFRDSWGSAAAMLAIGFFGNTLFISMYVRPKLAAEKSRVLNFYWMFVGLVTGVYTFGIVGILLGPVVIGLLKAVLDTVTTNTSWRLLESEEDAAAGEVAS